MCACSRENNQAPNLATLLQGTASTPGVVIDSSPSPGGRGHGRAPDPTRRPPRAPRIDAGQRHDLARGRRTRPGGGPVGGFVAGGGGEETWPGPCIAPGAVWRGRTPAGAGGGEAGHHDPSQDPAPGAEPSTVPPDARIAVQGVAADPSA